MNFLFRLIIGFFRIRFYSQDKERVLNYILEKNIPVWGIQREEDCLCFCVSFFHISHLKEFFESLSEGERVEKEKGGTLRLLQLFGKRWGFFLGAVIFFLSQYLSTLFIWGVVIYGNDQVETEVIREDLSKIGVAPGRILSQEKLHEIALRYQIEDDRFLYVNLNKVGTKVYAEVRERESAEKTVEKKGESNLVAQRYGTVVRYEVLDGQIQVKIGDKVTEGALLISGIRENKNGGFSAVRARGRVFAKTERSFEVTVPFEQTEKVFTGEEKSHKSYEILGLTLSLPQRTPFDDSLFETVEMKEDMTLFGYSLPIRIKEKIFLKTQEKKELIEVDRAQKLAYDKYKEFIRETFALEDEILEEKTDLSWDETGLTLSVTVTAVEDICKEIPFLYTVS